MMTFPGSVLFFLGAACFGILIGSFLNVVIHRLPRMLEGNRPFEVYNLAWPRSHCPVCGQVLSWWQNIPLLSFAVQRGRCVACGAAISWRYPFIELLTGVCFGLVGWHIGPSWLLPCALGFSAVLIALAAIDCECGLLPDALTYPLLWSGLLFNLYSKMVSLDAAVIGVVCGYVFLWGLYWGFRLLTGKEGLGYGDFKLLAALGAWLGWSALPQVLLLSSLTGLLVGGILMVSGRMTRSDALPFGPFLAFSGWLVWILGARF
jgi:leader peptidase (prepilin peptidase)/N-methyltransferase